VSVVGWTLRRVRDLTQVCEGAPSDVVLASDASFCLLGAGPELLRLSGYADWKVVARYRDGDTRVGPIELLPGDARCMTGQRDGHVRLWDLEGAEAIWRSEPAAPEPLRLVGMKSNGSQAYALGRTGLYHLHSATVFGKPPGTMHTKTDILFPGEGSVHFVRVDQDVGFVAWDRVKPRVRLDYRTCNSPYTVYGRDEFHVLAFDGCTLLPPERAALPGTVPVAFSLNEQEYEEEEDEHGFVALRVRPRRFAVVDGPPVASDGVCSFSPDLALVLRGHWTTLALVDVASRATLCQADAGPHPIANLAWSAALRTAITTDMMGGVTVWALEPPA